MRSLSHVGLMVAVIAPAVPAWADRASLTIGDVLLTVADVGGQSRQIDLGEITVTLANSTGSGMSAVFRVAPEFQPTDDGPSLWDHVEIHWVNIITEDDCPASVAGVPAGSRRLPFPLVDMPRHGWDYVYRWRSRRAPERTESNADGRELRDDARDIWPWYHTPEEEAMQPDSGNGGGGFGQFRRGHTYGIRDLPSLCDNGGLTAFTCLLVAVVPPHPDPAHRPQEHQADGVSEEAPRLRPAQLLVLAAFDWDWSSRYVRLEESAFSVDDLNLALQHSSFPEWMGVEGVPLVLPDLALADVGPVRVEPVPGVDADRPRRGASGKPQSSSLRAGGRG